MSAQGLLLLAAGIGLWWSARDNADVVSEFNQNRFDQWRRRGLSGRKLRFLAPAANRSSRVLLRGNYVLAAIVTVAGVLNIAGVWRV